jgi:hypothetical protein
MAIPNAREHDAPPPLIPDRHIGNQIQYGDDAGWKWGNSTNSPFGGIKPGSSLLGGQSRGSVSRSFEGLTLNNNNNNNMDGDSDEEGSMHRQVGSRSLESGGQTIRYDLLFFLSPSSPSSGPPLPH